MTAHPVLAALRDRPPGARLALVVEGGGMRGAVTGGMAVALEELGLAGAFDAVYGSSAGALNAMWLVSGRAAAGAASWWDEHLIHTLIEPRRVLRGGRAADIERLVEREYERLSPGVFAAALGSASELHPLATDADTGETVDLHAELRDEAALRLALRASANLPVLAGPPVRFAGRRWLDAGVTAAIPFRPALADGATHVLVLRSRREGDVVAPPGRLSGAVVGRAVGRVSPPAAVALATRAEREGADEAELARHAADPSLTPAVLSVRPAPGSPRPSRLERDVDVVRAALEAGREAALRALS